MSRRQSYNRLRVLVRDAMRDAEGLNAIAFLLNAGTTVTLFVAVALVARGSRMRRGDFVQHAGDVWDLVEELRAAGEALDTTGD